MNNSPIPKPSRCAFVNQLAAAFSVKNHQKPHMNSPTTQICQLCFCELVNQVAAFLVENAMNSSSTQTYWLCFCELVNQVMAFFGYKPHLNSPTIQICRLCFHESVNRVVAFSIKNTPPPPPPQKKNPKKTTTNKHEFTNYPNLSAVLL